MSRLENIRQERLAKLDKIKAEGIEPYPGGESAPSVTIGRLVRGFDDYFQRKDPLYLVGRVTAMRRHGGVAFVDLLQQGARIQVYLERQILGEDHYRQFFRFIDEGDFLRFFGIPFRTQKGEPSLKSQKWQLLAKAIRPLPAKWHGFKEKEERFRRRYLDFLLNQAAREKILIRIRLVQALRTFFIKKGFMEFDTPILQTLPGGALARPFQTHLDALDLDLYLRIAPELFLKRLLIGGFEKVFEMGKNFRNEGIDATHNPEFLMLEAYWSYHDYQDFMRLTESLFEYLTQALGTGETIAYRDRKLSLKTPWPRVTFENLLKEKCGVSFQSAQVELEEAVQRYRLKIDKKASRAALYDALFKKICLPGLDQPTFVVEHPLELSPLAKSLSNDKQHMARFQLIVGGMEVANGFSELNDPFEQEERFRQQSLLAKKGEEAHPYDREFIEALEYGMPPAAGVGYGIERLAALFADSPSLRESMPFPLMRPKRRA